MCNATQRVPIGTSVEVRPGRAGPAGAIKRAGTVQPVMIKAPSALSSTPAEAAVKITAAAPAAGPPQPTATRQIMGRRRGASA